MESTLEAVLDVLDREGIEYKKDSNRAKIVCPWHDEKTPSCVIYDSNSVFCFGCQKHAWHDELVAKLCNCTVIEAKKKLGTYDPNQQYIPRIPKLKIDSYEMADPPKDFSAAFDKLPTEIPKAMAKWLDKKGLAEIAINEGLWRRLS